MLLWRMHADDVCIFEEGALGAVRQWADRPRERGAAAEDGPLRRTVTILARTLLLPLLKPGFQPLWGAGVDERASLQVSSTDMPSGQKLTDAVATFTF